MWGRRNPQWWKSTRLGLQLLQTCQWWRQGSASTIMNSRSSTGRSLFYDRRTDPKFRICTERIWFLLATFTMFTWVISNYLMLVSHDLPVTQFTGIMLTMLAQKENMMIQVQLNHSGKFLMLKIHLHHMIRYEFHLLKLLKVSTIHTQDSLLFMEHTRLSSKMLLVTIVMVMVSFSKMGTKLKIRSVFWLIYKGRRSKLECKEFSKTQNSWSEILE